MNRIYRLVFNRTTGMMQVASELATSPLSTSPATDNRRRRSPLSAAMLVALGLSAASLPTAFAAVYDFNAPDIVNDSRAYVDGFRVGPNGQVQVDVRDGGKITSNGLVSVGTSVGSDGKLYFTGPTSTLSVNSASVRVGEAGKGELRLGDGAAATVAGGTVSFGFGADGVGIGRVEGAGSSLSARQLLVGREGAGLLDIVNGGRVEVTQPWPLAGTSFGMSIGTAAGGLGVVNVNTGGELVVTDNELRVGEAGTGTLNIDNGTVSVGRNLVLGAAQNAEGTVNVRNGGKVSAQLLSVGAAQDSGGTLLVSGAGSTVAADELRVSANGNGTLRVEDSAVVAVAGNVTAEDEQGLPSRHARTGRIEVSGAGSVLSGDRVITSTHLLVDNGGQIQSSSARIKDSYSSTGTATLTGTGSRWTNQGEMDIRTGVNVLDGAVINTGTLLVSGGANTATLLGESLKEQTRVSGAGSAIEADAGITVGSHLVGEPFAVLSVGNGGRVAAGNGDLSLGTSGYLAIGGGMDTWSVANRGPQWSAAEAAGELDGAKIVMQAASGGLVFNHTGDITLANTLASATGASGAVIQRAGNSTLTGNLANFGGRVAVSGGTLHITSDMYTGQGYAGTSAAPLQQIDVSGGTLVLDGSAGFRQTLNYGTETKVVRSSNVLVQGPGVLAGNGTVGDTYVVDGGTLSPGHGDVGTLGVDGDLYINTGVTHLWSTRRDSTFYDAQLRANGQADLISVTGKAYIGSKANLANSGLAAIRINALDPYTSYQQGQSYVILDAAGGIQGGFDNITTDSIFIRPKLTQTDNQVLVAVELQTWTNEPDPVDPGTPIDPVTPADPGTPVDPGFPGTPGVTPPIVFGAVAVTGNQRATAAALDSLQQSGDALALYNALLMLDEAGALVAFDDLGGELHASNRALLLDDRFLREGISQRLRPAPDTKLNGSSAWVAGSGASKRQDSDGTASRTQETRQGLMAGYDWTFGDRWTVGVAGGPESLRQQIRDRNAITEVDAVHGGLYAGFRGEQAWINGGASYADYEVDTRREPGAGTVWEQTLSSRHDAHSVQAFAEGGWDIPLSALTLSPYLAVAYTRLSSEAATETGGTAALSVASSKDEVWTTTAGIRAAWDISGGQTDGARLEAGLAWQNAAGELRADSRNRFVAGSDSFTVSGLPLARNVGIAELGVSLNTSDNSRLSMSAQGRAGDGQREVGAQLNWNVVF